MQSDRYCYKCGRPGHYAKVCRTKPSSITKKPAGKLSPAQTPTTSNSKKSPSWGPWSWRTCIFGKVNSHVIYTWNCLFINQSKGETFSFFWTYMVVFIPARHSCVRSNHRVDSIVLYSKYTCNSDERRSYSAIWNLNWTLYVIKIS